MLENKQIISWLFHQIKPNLSGFSILIFLNFSVAGISAYTAIQSKKIIDAITDFQNIAAQSVIYSVGMYLVLLYFMISFNYFIGVLNDSIKTKVTMKMQNNLIDSLFVKNYETTRQVHSGKINTFLYSDIPYISNGILTIVPHFVNMVTRLSLVLYLLFFLDTLLASILVCLGSILLVGTKFIRKYSQTLYKLMQEKNADTRAYIQDSILNILAVRVFRKVVQIEDRIEKLQKNEYQTMMKRSRLSQISSSVFSLIYQLGYIIVLIWGGYRLSKGNLTIGSLAALIQLSSQVQAPIANLAGLVPIYWGVISSSKRVMEFSIDKGDTQKEEQSFLIKDRFDQLTAENVMFQYHNKKVLKNVNFTIKRGDIVAITGKSGSGKTTLLMLLTGLIENEHVQFSTQSGDVISPCDIKNMFVSFVPQKELLFEGTVKENICFFDETISDDRLVSAAKIAEAHSFIVDLKKGYDERISESGKSLSQGQAQRIAIARAIYSNNDIIILDEATSALDYETEKKILSNVIALNKTVIMITHRSEALKYATQHFHIEKGRLQHV